MQGPFEITGDDIAHLDDGQLRELVARLAEAELSLSGLSPLCVRAGGHQDAPDGGIDVKIEIPTSRTLPNAFPKYHVAYQVKKGDLNPGSVTKEIKPRGRLRSSIRTLAEHDGAYIVVTGASLTELQYQRRREAIADALGDVHLAHDIMDCRRIATWARSFPSIGAWIRQTLSKPLYGWSPYGPWSGTSVPFVADEQRRVSTLPDLSTLKPWDDIDAIEHIRQLLSLPGRAVRVIGLSGVGKTRIAEAIFDMAIGSNAISPTLAIYCDVADNPAPPPPAFAAQMISDAQRNVLVVDNCPPDLHRAIARTIRNSGVSLLSIEYDVRDDVPEDGDVIVFGAMSDRALDEVLHSAFPKLEYREAQRIIEFSGGNCRLALALAKSQSQGSSIASLRDDQLLRRLFFQRHGPDDRLMRCAEACSLVYSFSIGGVSEPEREGEPGVASESELPALAEIAEVSEATFYRDVAELQERRLVQRRSHWRALLPQALANRLAVRTLRRLHPKRAASLFSEAALARLQRSFARRLTFIHEEPEARQIFDEWLQPGGQFHDLLSVSAADRQTFWSVAPTMGRSVLDVIERAIVTDERKSAEFVADRKEAHSLERALHRFAHDPDTFDQAANLLTQLARLSIAQKKDDPRTGWVLSGLFTCRCSQTQASPVQRQGFVRQLIRSKDPVLRQCASIALEQMLRIRKFSYSPLVVGSWNATTGWEPRDKSEEAAWYSTALKLCTEFILLNDEHGPELKRRLAEQFPKLWNEAGVNEDLIEAIQKVAGQTFWLEGWTTVRDQAQRWGRYKPLVELEKTLAPKAAPDIARAVALYDRRVSVYALQYDTSDKSLINLAAQCASELTQDPDFIAQFVLMGGLIQISFAYGLGRSAVDPAGTWSRFYAAFQSANTQNGIAVLASLLAGIDEQSPSSTQEILQNTGSPFFEYWYPAFQIAVRVDVPTSERIAHSIASGGTDPKALERANLPRRLDDIDTRGLETILEALATHNTPDAAEAGVRLLSKYIRIFSPDPFSMRFGSEEFIDHFLNPKKKERFRLDSALQKQGRLLLCSLRYEGVNSFKDGHAHTVADFSFDGDVPIEETQRVYEAIVGSFRRTKEVSPSSRTVIDALLRAQPDVMLDEMLTSRARIEAAWPLLWPPLSSNGSALGWCPEHAVRRWIDKLPAQRFPIAATLLPIFAEGAVEWGRIQMATLASYILEKAPNRQLIMQIFEERIDLRSGYGFDDERENDPTYRFDPIERRRAAMAEWRTHSDRDIREWATRIDKQLVVKARNRGQDAARGNTFED